MTALRHIVLGLLAGMIPAGAQLTWQLAGGSASWPADKRAAIIAAMDEAVSTYNANGYFPKALWANYNPGVPTAQASYSGWIDFGGSISARVALHEISHTLGVGQYDTWSTNQSGGKWTGTYAINRVKLYDGSSAVIGCDTNHFWPYGLNYDIEDSSTNRVRHVHMVSAMRRDMGIVADSDSDGLPDDWEIFNFGDLGKTASGDADGDGQGNLAEYNADTNPALAIFQWTGGSSGTWTTAANWSGPQAPSGAAYFSRLNVNNGSGNALVYDAARGTTNYRPADRGLVIGSGSAGSGAMRITGGSFSTAGATGPDVIGNGSGNTGSLTIEGGAFISPELHLGVAAQGTGTFTIQGGTATVTSLIYRFDTGGTGTVHLNGGTLVTGGLARATDAAGTANFRFNGGTLKVSASNTAFLENINSALVRTNGALIDTNGKDVTIAQALLNDASFPGGGLVKSGTGTLTLSGANTYTGLTDITEGTLEAANAAALGSSSGDTSVAGGATLALSGGVSMPAGEAVSIAGTGEGSRGALQSSSGANTWNGPVTVTASDTRIGVQDGASLTIAGSITESAPGTDLIFRTGLNSGNDLILSGSGHSWTGSTAIYSSSSTGGAVRLGGNDVLPTGSVLLVAGSGVAGRLDLNGFNQTCAGLTHGSGSSAIGAAVITNGAATPSVLTLNVPGSVTRDFSGEIRTGTGGLALVKSGSGTQILSDASTYAGGTTVEGGTLRQGVAGAFGSTSAPLTVNGGGVNLYDIALGVGRLEGAGGVVHNNGAASEAVLTLGNGNATGGIFTGTLADRATGTGTLAVVKTGTGTQTLGGNNTFSGTLSVNGGVLILSSATAPGATSKGTIVASGATLSLADGTSVNGETVTISGSGQGFNGALQAAAGGSATWNGPVVLGDSSARLGGTRGALTVSGPILGNGTNQSVFIGAGVGGAGTVIISNGTGHTYTGVTGILRGTLQLGADNALPVGTVLDVDTANAAEDAIFDLNGRTQQIAGLRRTNTGGGTGRSLVTNTSLTTATLQINLSSDTTFPGQITGNLSLVKTGGAQLTLSHSSNSPTGNITVSGGILALSNAFISSTSTVSVSSGARLALQFTGSDSVGALYLGGLPMPPGTYNATSHSSWFSGTGSLVVLGSGGFNAWVNAQPGLTADQRLPLADPDNDGQSNLLEFALGGSPVLTTSNARLSFITESTGGGQSLTLTIAVRRGTPAFSGSPSPSSTSEGITYTVQGTQDLQDFAAPVIPVIPAVIPAGLPDGGDAYEYRSFRIDTTQGFSSRGFLRVVVDGQ